MKLIILSICLLSFLGLMIEFYDLGGMNYKLLKIIAELLIILFIMIIMKYKDELIQMTKYDKYQKKLDDYFLPKEKKTNK